MTPDERQEALDRAYQLQSAYDEAASPYPAVRAAYWSLERATRAHRADAEADLVRCEREASAACGRDLTSLREAWFAAALALTRVRAA